MKTVRILSGAYGFHPGGGKSVKPVFHGQTVDVPDEEAERLSETGAAEIIGEADAKTAENTVATNAESFSKAKAGGNTEKAENAVKGEKTAHPALKQRKGLSSAKLTEPAEDAGPVLDAEEPVT